MAAREMLRVCVDTAVAPDAIRALAISEGWQPTDPLALKARNRVVIRGKKKGDERVYQRSSAWTYSKNGTELTIGLFDYPDLPRNSGKQCEVLAWDLDAATVDETILGDVRVSAEPSFPGLPIKNYRIPSAGLQISYVSSDAGSKMIHVLTVN